MAGISRRIWEHHSQMERRIDAILRFSCLNRVLRIREVTNETPKNVNNLSGSRANSLKEIKNASYILKKEAFI